VENLHNAGNRLQGDQSGFQTEVLGEKVVGDTLLKPRQNGSTKPAYSKILNR
jgi:hypothetical protein